MEYIVLDQETEKKLNEITKKISALQNWGYDESVKNLHIDQKKYNGAGFIDLKRLANNYQPDLNMASILWNTQKREEQIVACFLLPTDTNKEKITQLASLCSTYEVAEYLGAIHIAKRTDLPEIISLWKNTTDALQQTALLTAVARHLITQQEAPLITTEEFQQLLNQKYEDKYVQLIIKRHQNMQ
ncbi:hypothetical protein LJB85_02590 [Porphyromonadaceae bacterium OttesenSCG-928-L07]|nr:hypothetical protein [Porphyromonadaceae bacterium OttesenSCG-928-L07]MDL2251800.1 hypothetical protein [Odoribacter sp. OttesenSCG-928-J03]MDL2330855.1 hypothetical protein [Odoribacter sp. OttesenSCG-928-A06]